MAVGDIERMVEGLVNRGLISPKMVGRSVGQATIEELKNLGSNLAESSATLQRNEQQRLSLFKVQAAKDMAKIPGYTSQQTSKQFAPKILGKVGEAYNVALPGAGGQFTPTQFRPETSLDLQALEKLLPQGMSLKDIPESNVQFMWPSRKAAQLQDIMKGVMDSSQSAQSLEQLVNYYNKFQF